eukprot:CAMPEP_0172378028 /NCGR_PEP_ID=MMETSP1060-20121228/69215_1 /TAXON_ID=37318 /ORGANISM="Pseudo-nitzschia pungens, Strain cf. cingulata" /LENGTH=446 /DNA_ID=CAMNT_0013105741 /DNA_START=156 /DNA_END=1496 /DNA_ORIENTATION=-
MTSSVSNQIRSRKRVSVCNGRRMHALSFSLLVSFAAFEISMSFVPLALRTSHVSRTAASIASRLKQQLTKIEPMQSNGRLGGEIEIDKSVQAPKTNNTTTNTKTQTNTNTQTKTNTKSFGMLKPRRDDVFPRDSVLQLSKTRIENVVDDMLESTRSIGLFGETMYAQQKLQEEEAFESIPRGNTVLATSASASASAKTSVRGQQVRVATPVDDLDIANLRLSVFSNFNPESRKLFCERSCQLLSSRRQRGATCIVATTGKHGNSNNDSNNDSDSNDNNNNNKPRMVLNPRHKRKNKKIVGTAEVSSHEFSQTLLGYSRPKDSILYVTEVAVDSSQRRKGIARLMMDAIDSLADIREVETIYLHVDVTNSGAVRLYEQAGYRKLDSGDPMYLEFTTKLNLHDGATKGRCHFLMAKDLRQPTWLSLQEQQKQYQPHRRTLGIEVMSTF